jgi:hypothetical protein
LRSRSYDIDEYGYAQKKQRENQKSLHRVSEIHLWRKAGRGVT